MGIDAVDAWGGPPVAQQAVLDVFRTERLIEKRIVDEIDLRGRQIIGGSEISFQGVKVVRYATVLSLDG